MSGATCVILFRVSDCPRLMDKYDSNNILSISPYPTSINSRVNDWRLMKGKDTISDTPVKDCIQYDATNDVYFIDLSNSMHFKTLSYTWPETYTILLWIKWRPTKKRRERSI